MPEPKKGESQKDYIARCIPTVMNEGTTKDNKQAAAICFSKWKQHHKNAKGSPELESFAESLSDYLSEAKKDKKDNKNKDKDEEKESKKEENSETQDEEDKEDKEEQKKNKKK